MQRRTPIDAAVAAYCADWRIAKADERGVAAVNPETLGNSTAPDFSFRYIDISSVSQGRIDWKTVESVRFADAPSRARRVLRPGDTLICTVRPLLGSHASADWDERDGYVCSTGFAVVRSAGEINSRFLKHLPFAEQVVRQLVAWQCGTNYPAVNERDIRVLRLPVPPPAEQVAIARALDAVDTALERTRVAVDEANELKRALLQRFFYVALGVTAYADRPTKKLPAGWALVPTETLLSGEPKNGVSPKASSQPPGTPTFSIAAVRGGRVNLENGENIKYAQVPEKAAMLFRINSGDVLIVRGNANPDLVGKAGMVDRFPDGCIYPDITKRVTFRTKGERTVLPAFAVLAWNHPIVHNQILRRAKTSNGTLKINSRDVKQIIMPVPPRAEQESIVKLMDAVAAKERALSAKQSALQQLKKSLMHDLLTGTVRVQPRKVAAILRK